MAGLTMAGTKDTAGVREAEGLEKSKSKQDQTERNPTAEEVCAVLDEEDNDGDNRDVVHAFQIKYGKVSTVAQRCLALHYPALEEYDFISIRTSR